MRILSLHIEKYKNLENIDIEFDKSYLTTVLLGWNGTGKSNLLEVLIAIFRDLDFGEVSSFQYKIKYICRGNIVSITSGNDRNLYKICVNDEDVSFAKFTHQDSYGFRPDHVFGYYSGFSGRMSAYFEKHEKRFSQELLNGYHKPLRKLFLARPWHSQFVLLAFMLEDGSMPHSLSKYLNIESIGSVLFTIRKPGWNSKEGASEFWNARGVVSEFLNELHQTSFAPMPCKKNKKLKDAYDRYYFYYPTAEYLYTLINRFETKKDFFKTLESASLNDLLESVIVRAKIKGRKECISFAELSEGEQQLLSVLGLIKFTKEDESLFLLDEPDTHLNPAWTRMYNKLLCDTVDDDNVHIIMATHDPMVVSGLEQGQVRIFEGEGKIGEIRISEPLASPRGMGANGVLTSDMFGLETTLDEETVKLIDKHARLSAKREKSKQENEEMDKTRKDLNKYGFLAITSDALYNRFRKIYNERIKTQEESATKTDKERQMRIAQEIVEELRNEIC